MNKLTEIKQRLNNLNQRGTAGFFALEEFRSFAESDIEYLISLLEEKDKALELCLIAGNSLAGAVQSYDLPDENHNWTFEQARKYFHDRYYLDSDVAHIRYETWLAWKTIRDISLYNTSSNNEGDKP